VIGKVHRLKIVRLEKAPVAAASKEEADPAVEVVEEPSVVVAFAPEKSDKSKKLEGKKPQEKSAPALDKVVSMNGKREATKAAIKEENAAIPLTEAKGQASQSDEAQVPAEDDGIVVPISRRLTLLQLTENTCKWPIGDPLGAGFHFCGAKTCEGSPYCSYHSKIAFQPLAERRRIRV